MRPFDVLRRPRTWLAAVAVVLVIAVVGPFVYINFVHGDQPERLAFEDATTSTTAANRDDASPVAGDESPSLATGIDGNWTVAEGQAGYRVKEILFGQDTEAVGRTSEVAGELQVDGATVTAATFTVDLTSVESDETRRDRQFHRRIMDTATYPTATFTLTDPISLAAVPADGEELAVRTTGKLTIHGVTNLVTVDLAVRRAGETFQVNATIPVTFADYDIPDASFGPATVEDHGEIELLLTFAPV